MTAPATSPDIRPLAAPLGAEVRGVDLGAPLADDAVAAIRSALARHLLLLFRSQRLDDAAHVALAARLGEPMVHPALRALGHPTPLVSFRYGVRDPRLNSRWHTDVSYAPAPPALGIARAVVVPVVGGDTLWTSAYAAYEALAPGLRRHIAGRRAWHDAAPAVGGAVRHAEGEAGLHAFRHSVPATAHPIVCRHPASGRPYLFVNPGFTTRVDGLSAGESRELLAELFAPLERAEQWCRCEWMPGTVALWDERATQHRLVPDYHPSEREVRRVAVAGTPPVAA